MAQRYVYEGFGQRWAQMRSSDLVKENVCDILHWVYCAVWPRSLPELTDVTE